ncbi:zinc-binding dehydrogenase [Enterobacter hormaechei]|nr:zinc-binding dehydrogenase [Enterobacter hormaechei]
MGAGFLKPQIDKCFKFEELREAHQYLESNQQIGKIIVRVDPV